MTTPFGFYGVVRFTECRLGAHLRPESLVIVLLATLRQGVTRAEVTA